MAKVVNISATQVTSVLAWLRRNNVQYKLNQKDTVTTVTLEDADIITFDKMFPTTKPVVIPVIKVDAPAPIKKSRFKKIFKKFW